MIKSIFGVTKEPFNRSELALLSQQKKIAEIIKIHSQQGGFSVIIGNPGVGKSVLREHIEKLEKEHGPLPETLTFKTPTGGAHLIFHGPLRCCIGFREGLDVKGNGGYIVGPGSTIGSRSYSIKKEVKIAECPV